MNHADFEERFHMNSSFFFDADKKKYQLVNEVSGLSDFELTRLRKQLQLYNAQWTAYRHGFTDGVKAKYTN